MNRLARFASRAFFAVAVAALALALFAAGIALYLGTWPIRRAARSSATGARIAAAQQLLVALAAAASVMRSRDSG